MKALGKGSIASIVQIGLAIAWWVLWVVLGILVLAGVVYGAVHVLIAAGALDARILAESAGQIQVGADDGAPDFSYAGPGGMSWPVVVPALVIGFVFIAGALVIVGRLRRLFDSFTSGEPFRRENADHLRVIWITMLIMEIARYVLLGAIAATFAAVGVPKGADADFQISVDFSTWMSIAILIVLAEVFREGARMKEEQELTI